jgi:hypothetical protein
MVDYIVTPAHASHHFLSHMSVGGGGGGSLWVEACMQANTCMSLKKQCGQSYWKTNSHRDFSYCRQCLQDAKLYDTTSVTTCQHMLFEDNFLTMTAVSDNTILNIDSNKHMANTRCIMCLYLICSSVHFRVTVFKTGTQFGLIMYVTKTEHK